MSFVSLLAFFCILVHGMIAKVTYQKTVLLVEIKKNGMSYLNQFKKETK